MANGAVKDFILKQTQSGASTSTVKQRIAAQEANSLMDKINALQGNVQSIGNQYNQRYFDANGQPLPLSWRADAIDWLKAVEPMNAAANEASALRWRLQRYESYLDADTYKKATDTLDAINSSAGSIYSQAKQENDIFSRFQNADDYNRAVELSNLYAGWDTKTEKQIEEEWNNLNHNLTLAYGADDAASIDATNKRLGELTGYILGTERLADTPVSAMAADYRYNRNIEQRNLMDLTFDRQKAAEWGANHAMSYGDEIVSEFERYQMSPYEREYTLELNRLDSEIMAHEHSPQYIEMSNINLRKQKGYDEKVASRPYTNPTRAEMDSYDAADHTTQSAPIVNDPLRVYLDSSQKDKEDAVGVVANAHENGKSSTYYEYVAMGGDKRWDLLTKDEINDYYYYLSESPEAGMQYLDRMETVLNARAMREYNKEISELPLTQRQALSVMSSIYYSVLSPIEGVKATLLYGLGGITGKNLYDKNDNKLISRTDAFRANTAEEMNKSGKTFLGVPIGNLFQGVVSGADSLMMALYTLGAGIFIPETASATALKVFKEAPGAALGMSAARSKMDQVYEQGGKIPDVLLMGFTAYATEWLTERFSIGMLLDDVTNATSKNFWKGLKSAAAQVGVNAAEEGAARLLETGLDLLFQNRTEYTDVIRQKMAEGKSREEATKDATRQFWSDLLGDVLGGAIGGGMFAGTSVASSVAYNSMNKAYATDIIESGMVDRTIASAQTTLAQLKEGSGQYKRLNAAIEAVQEEASVKNVQKLLRQFDLAVTSVSANAISEMAPIIGEDEAKQLKSNIKTSGENLAVAQMASDEELAKKAVEHKLKTGNVTVDLKTGNDIKIEGVYRTREKGNPTLVFKLADGSTIKYDDVSYSSNATAAMAQVISETGIRADYATFLLNSASDEGGLDAAGVRDAILSGMIGEAVKTARHAGMSYALTDAQFKTAYEAGKTLAKDNLNREIGLASQKTVPTTQTENKDGKVVGHFYDGTEGAVLRSTTKAQIGGVEAIAKATNVNVEIYASSVVDGVRQFTDRRGAVHKGNAAYIPGINTIVIDINAGNALNGLVLNSLAHEVVHFIKEMAPDKFRKLADFVVGKFGEKGKSVTSLILAKQKTYRMQGYELSFMEAYEEVVADSVESMFSQKADKIVADIAEMRKVDADLAKTFVDKIKDTFKKMLSVFKENDFQPAPDSEEGKFFAEWQEVQDELAHLFAEGAAAAADRVATAAKKSDSTLTKENTPAEAGAKHSFRGYAADGRGMYEGNFPKGTPKQAKADVILRYIQNVWSKKPIRLIVKDGVNDRIIHAKFDPEYDEGGSNTDASKLMGGNRHGSAAEKRVTLDLADDYYQLLSDAQYNYSKGEEGKTADTHNGVFQWHYFINDIYFSEHGTAEYIPYRVSINVKERSDGNFVYSFSAEKQNGASPRQTLHAAVSGKDAAKRNSVSIDSISNPSEKSNPSDEKISNSLRSVSERQTIVDMLNSLPYEVEHNEYFAEYLTKVKELDKMQEKVDALNAEWTELAFAKGKRSDESKARLAEIRKQTDALNAKITKLDRRLLDLAEFRPFRNLVKAAVKRQKAKGRDALSEYRKNVKTRAQRERVVRVIKDINTYLIKNTKDKHVPSALRKQFANVMSAFNLDWSARENKTVDGYLLKIQKEYEKIAGSSDPVVGSTYDPGVDAEFARVIDLVEETSVHDMNQEQLDAVYNLFKMMRKMITTANQLRAKNMSMTAQNAAYSSTDELKAAKTKERHAPGTKAGQAIEQRTFDDLKPIYFFSRLGSPTMQKLFQNILEGQYVYANDIREAEEFITTLNEKYKAKKWKADDTFTFTDKAGEAFQLTRREVWDIYAHSRREQSRKHLLKHGIVLKEARVATDKNAKGVLKKKKHRVDDTRNHPLSEAVIGDILSDEVISAEEKAYVEELQKYLSVDLAQKGNEVSLAMYDVALYGEKNYWPIKTAKWYNEFDPQGKGNPSIATPNHSKGVAKHAASPIMINDALTTWNQHVHDMAAYHGMAIPVSDFTRVVNAKTLDNTTNVGGVRQTLEELYGPAPGRYIAQMLKDLNGNVVSGTDDTLAEIGITMAKKAAVMLSLSVAIQQPSSLMRATLYIKPKYFASRKKYEGMTVGNVMKRWNQLCKIAPVAYLKEMGGYDTGLGRTATEHLRKLEGKKVGDTINDIMGFMPSFMDKISWLKIYDAAVAQVTDEAAQRNENLSKAEIEKRAVALFNETIEKTQVYDSTLTRSGTMRKPGALTKSLTAFGAEPTVSTNMMSDAIVRARRGEPGAKKMLAKTYGAVISAALVNALLKAIVTAPRDDDENEMLYEKYIGNVLNSFIVDAFIFTNVPVVRDIVSMLQGFSVDRMDLSVFQDIFDKWKKVFNGDLTWVEVVDAVVELFSLTPVPLRNVWRDLKGAYNFVVTLGKDISGENKPTWTGLGIAVKDSIPILPDTSKQNALYMAYASGRQGDIQYFRSQYASATAADTAIKDALKKNDRDVREAAMLRYNGNIERSAALVNKIAKRTRIPLNLVQEAVMSELEEKPKEEYNGEEETETSTPSAYTTTDLKLALEQGRNTAPIVEAIIADKKANGATRNQARNQVRQSAWGAYKSAYYDAYKRGNKSEMDRIKKILLGTKLWTESELKNTLSNFIKNKEEE